MRTEIPKLNSQVIAGGVSLEEFIAVIERNVARTCSTVTAMTVGAQLDRTSARKAIQLLGFMISSAERQFQSRGLKKGEALSRMGRAEEILLALAPQAAHPPRDTAYTYWMWNAEEKPLTFTGDEQEVLFNQVINHSDRLFKASCDVIRPICAWEVSVESEEAARLIRRAAENMVEARAHFMSLMAYTDDTRERRRFEPDFFMKVMRTYLTSYPVGGEEWEGVSAANLASQMALDCLAGTVNAGYLNHIAGRLKYFPAEERDALEADMKSDSLLTVFRQVMGAPDVAFTDEGAAIMRTIVSCQCVEFQSSLRAYRDFIRAAGALTASHWSLISNYLTKPSAALPPEERERLAVNPEKGTSGMTMEDVARIRDMRRKHEMAEKLIAHAEDK